jgi:Domain of unknown function (DUF1707)
MVSVTGRSSVAAAPGTGQPDFGPGRVTLFLTVHREVPVAGPWEQMAHHGQMRASDADRDRAAAALEAGYRQGLLGAAELRDRTGQVLASRTYAELTAATAVLAARLPAGVPAAKRITPKVVAGSACAIVLPPAIVAAFLTYYGGFIILCLVACAGLFASGALMTPRRPGPPV